MLLNLKNCGKKQVNNMQVYPPAEDSWLLKEAILKENLKGKKCLDMGTGSGIQSRAMVTAGAEIVTAVDINPTAIKQAMKNNSKLKDKITFFNGDLFSFMHNNPDEKFDLIAFNPPYVPSDNIKWKDTDGGERGREIIDIFINEVREFLAPGGVLLLLVSSHNNEGEVVSVLSKKGFVSQIILEKKLFFEKLFILRCVM
jgi:release factor glutamine methyltransferase